MNYRAREATARCPECHGLHGLHLEDCPLDDPDPWRDAASEDGQEGS